MKTKKEQKTINNELEALDRRYVESTDDEMEQVTGGYSPTVLPDEEPREYDDPFPEDPQPRPYN